MREMKIGKNRQQRGAVLIVALVMLLLLTLVGIAGIRGQGHCVPGG
jgi:DNA phosphorothioation-dependent restriction protein DptG